MVVGEGTGGGVMVSVWRCEICTLGRGGGGAGESDGA